MSKFLHDNAKAIAIPKVFSKNSGADKIKMKPMQNQILKMLTFMFENCL